MIFLSSKAIPWLDDDPNGPICCWNICPTMQPAEPAFSAAATHREALTRQHFPDKQALTALLSTGMVSAGVGAR